MLASSVYSRLEAMQITLSDVLPAVVNGYVPSFVPVVQSGNLMYISGRLAKKAGSLLIGKLGAEITTQEGKDAAREVAVEILCVLHSTLGDLERVRRMVRVVVMVNSTADYTESHVVANGASELFVEVFGERGRHARSAFGVAQAPFGSCLEIEAVAEIECDQMGVYAPKSGCDGSGNCTHRRSLAADCQPNRMRRIRKPTT